GARRVQLHHPAAEPGRRHALPGGARAAPGRQHQPLPAGATGPQAALERGRGEEEAVRVQGQGPPEGLPQLHQDAAAAEQHPPVHLRDLRLQPGLRLRERAALQPGAGGVGEAAAGGRQGPLPLRPRVQVHGRHGRRRALRRDRQQFPGQRADHLPEPGEPHLPQDGELPQLAAGPCLRGLSLPAGEPAPRQPRGRRRQGLLLLQRDRQGVRLLREHDRVAHRPGVQGGPGGRARPAAAVDDLPEGPAALLAPGRRLPLQRAAGHLRAHAGGAALEGDALLRRLHLAVEQGRFGQLGRVRLPHAQRAESLRRALQGGEPRDAAVVHGHQPRAGAPAGHVHHQPHAAPEDQLVAADAGPGAELHQGPLPDGQRGPEPAAAAAEPRALPADRRAPRAGPARHLRCPLPGHGRRPAAQGSAREPQGAHHRGDPPLPRRPAGAPAAAGPGPGKSRAGAPARCRRCRERSPPRAGAAQGGGRPGAPALTPLRLSPAGSGLRGLLRRGGPGALRQLQPLPQLRRVRAGAGPLLRLEPGRLPPRRPGPPHPPPVSATLLPPGPPQPPRPPAVLTPLARRLWAQDVEEADTERLCRLANASQPRRPIVPPPATGAPCQPVWLPPNAVRPLPCQLLSNLATRRWAHNGAPINASYLVLPDGALILVGSPERAGTYDCWSLEEGFRQLMASYCVRVQEPASGPPQPGRRPPAARDALETVSTSRSTSAAGGAAARLHGKTYWTEFLVMCALFAAAVVVLALFLLHRHGAGMKALLEPAEAARRPKQPRKPAESLPLNGSSLPSAAPEHKGYQALHDNYVASTPVHEPPGPPRAFSESEKRPLHVRDSFVEVSPACPRPRVRLGSEIQDSVV
uniref:Semaphorin 4B n=1 Tax=Apteryx owenii TaxID=8824 RepID=A0A8B9PMB1_APTOW